MPDLTVLAHEGGNPEIKWAPGADPCGDNAPLLRWSSTVTTPAFKFRAVLTDEKSIEVEVNRV
jgi:hypothetical protein